MPLIGHGKCYDGDKTFMFFVCTPNKYNREDFLEEVTAELSLDEVICFH